MIELKEITSKDIWIEMYDTHEFSYFLQSWQWGDFCSLGLKQDLYRLGIYQNDQLIGLAQVTSGETRFGKYAYCPRGPVLDWDNQDLAEQVLIELKNFFKGKGYIFLRVDPGLDVKDYNYDDVYKKLGFKRSVRYSQAERVWKVDILPTPKIPDSDQDDALTSSIGPGDEDQIRWMREHGMSKSMPNAIRKSAKSGVSIRSSNSSEDVDIFYDLFEQMKQRKGVGGKNRQYYRQQMKHLGPDNTMRVFIAEHEGVPVAAAILGLSKDEGAYLHGGSVALLNKLQAPKLLQWEMIKYCRDLGISKYNFWGTVAEKDLQPGKPGYGVSVFKRSFGGYAQEYIRSRDFPFDAKKYKLFSLQETYRIKRYKDLW